jgi:glucose/arabinose dehydrogenase
MVLATGFILLAAPPAGLSAEFRDDWALPEGFDLRIDTEGYELPTAIAFVPDAGTAPKSPLYFVVELRGRVKVVTRDRSVSTFADVGIPEPTTKYPDLSAQNGAAGLCLDQERGYVFVTYSAFGSDGALRNAIVRFDSRQRTFALRAGRRLDIKRIFAAYPTSANHQIGGCVVVGDALFVGVGDGAVSTRARDLDAPSGKVLRMTLDGKPHAGNPFVQGARPSSARAYVWAYGLRNPFGLAAVDGELFATHNGNAIDSFLRIERGADYGWNGFDSTIAANAEAVMNPATGPVHLAFAPKGSRLVPAEWSSTFFFGASVSSAEQGAGVLAIGYDLERGWVTEPPRSFVRFRRKSGGEVAGVALGPDGLYFAPLAPGVTGTSPVYRVVYDPAASYPHTIALSGQDLWVQYGCSGCHQLFGIGGTTGPSLDRPGLEDRIAARLASGDYKQRVAELNRTAEEPFVSYRDERRKVLAQDGDDQVASWIAYKVLEPRFDDPAARMPKLGLNETQAEAVSRFLMGREGELLAEAPQATFAARARNAVGSRRFAGGFGAGVALTIGLLAASWFVVRRRRAR